MSRWVQRDHGSVAFVGHFATVSLLDVVARGNWFLAWADQEPRTVGMDPAAFEYIAHWLVYRHQRSISDTAPLFCMLGGRPLDSSYVRLLFHRLGVAAGIAKRVHPHGLRHTHAARPRAEGIDIGIISKQLGHTSIATTARYLVHIAPVAVLTVLRQRAW